MVKVQKKARAEANAYVVINDLLLKISFINIITMHTGQFQLAIPEKFELTALNCFHNTLLICH